MNRVDKPVSDAEGKALCVPLTRPTSAPTAPLSFFSYPFQLDKGGFKINIFQSASNKQESLSAWFVHDGCYRLNVYISPKFM